MSGTQKNNSITQARVGPRTPPPRIQCTTTMSLTIYTSVICGKVDFIIDILPLSIDDTKKHDNKEPSAGMTCSTNELTNHASDFVFKSVSQCL